MYSCTLFGIPQHSLDTGRCSVHSSIVKVTQWLWGDGETIVFAMYTTVCVQVRGILMYNHRFFPKVSLWSMVSVSVQEISVVPSTFPCCERLLGFDDLGWLGDLLGWHLSIRGQVHTYVDTRAMIQFSKDTVYDGSFDTVQFNLIQFSANQWKCIQLQIRVSQICKRITTYFQIDILWDPKILSATWKIEDNMKKITATSHCVYYHT